MAFPWEVSPFDPLNGQGSPLLYPGLEPTPAMIPPQWGANASFTPPPDNYTPPIMPGPAPSFAGDLGTVQPSATPEWTSPEPTSSLTPEDTTSLPPPPGIAAGENTPRQPPIAMLGTPSLPDTDPGGLATTPAPIETPAPATGGSPFAGSWANPFEPTATGGSPFGGDWSVPGLGVASGGGAGQPMDIRSDAQKGGLSPAGGGDKLQGLLKGLAGMAAPQVPAAQRVATPSAPVGFRAPGRGNAAELMAALGIRGRQAPPYDLPSTFGRALRG